jgi:virulence-associated protein VapD
VYSTAFEKICKRFARHTFQNVSGSVMLAPHGARSF